MKKEEQLKETALTVQHLELGARMAGFAGWLMPIRYPQGTVAEHLHTRSAASVFDICHMGEFLVSGKAAAAFLDRLLPRKTSTLAVGQCRYNFLLTPEATVKDDLIVYRLGESEFMLVVNAGTARADYEWLQQHCPENVSIKDISAQTAKLDLQGPQSISVLEDCGISHGQLPRRYAWSRLTLFGHEILISGTGYTGETGFELYIPVQVVKEFWCKLLEHDKVAPAGLGSRDTLRLEMGYPLYGHELDENTTPIEAGFKKLLKPREDTFIGADKLMREPEKYLCGLCLQGRQAARAGMEIWNLEGEVIGTVTSGAYAPSVGKAVGLGYIKSNCLEYGIKVQVGEKRTRTLVAEVCKPPFV